MRPEELIAEGLAFFHIGCDEEAARKLSVYIAELMRWNERVNLVGLTDVSRVIEELLCDAFFLSGHVPPQGKILDLGSGSGIIAIPLKILLPEAEIYAVDSSLRKVQFQRHIRRLLSLEGFAPLHERIEQLPPLGVESVVVKAFGPIRRILEMSEGHMKEGGRAFLLKGAKEEAAEVRGFQLKEDVPYVLPFGVRKLRLLVYRKSGHEDAI